jgi:hypothetical protein
MRAVTGAIERGRFLLALVALLDKLSGQTQYEAGGWPCLISRGSLRIRPQINDDNDETGIGIGIGIGRGQHVTADYCW